LLNFYKSKNLKIKT